MAGKTLYDKLWDDHVVTQRDDGSCLLLYRPSFIA